MVHPDLRKDLSFSPPGVAFNHKTPNSATHADPPSSGHPSTRPTHHDRTRGSYQQDPPSTNHTSSSARLVDPQPGPQSGAKVDYHDEWFRGQDPEDLVLTSLANINPNSAPRQSEYYETYTSSRESAGRWTQPRYHPGKAYERGLAKERMVAPVVGGRSKKAQLGSIAESWGPMPKQTYIDGVDDPKGMFELLNDPPSRNTSPFKEDVEDWETIRVEALARARRGTPYEKMGGDEVVVIPAGERGGRAGGGDSSAGYEEFGLVPRQRPGNERGEDGSINQHGSVGAADTPGPQPSYDHCADFEYDHRELAHTRTEMDDRTRIQPPHPAGTRLKPASTSYSTSDQVHIHHPQSFSHATPTVDSAAPESHARYGEDHLSISERYKRWLAVSNNGQIRRPGKGRGFIP